VNRLARETSPYLLQHQNNPVDWYPWGEEPFLRARREDRPILVSVGYSACHWCHVMAHESFEDPVLAAVQNRLFVSIKVDREEHPDVDRVFMDVVQALTGGGGWPMTVFLLPDGRPFFAGTYFPPQDRMGLPGFGRVLGSVAQAYRERREEVVATAEKLSLALAPAPLVPASPSEELLTRTTAAAEGRLLGAADPDNGGFGGAPKFPQCAVLEFLLARHVLNHKEASWEVVERALQGMAAGGIRDQLDEGFHRYSVDGRWAVPHFEKMLYDNAQLARIFLHAWQAHHHPGHLDLARRTLDFLLRRMELPGGGFAASLDADTAAGEGAPYLWSTEEVALVVGEERLALAQRLFSGPGEAVTDQGGWVLRGGQDLAGLAEELGVTAAELEAEREAMVGLLAAARAARPQSGRDPKLIVGWNALAILALCEFATASGEQAYLEAARRCARAILEKARVGGQLHHLFDGSTARFPAALDDLAGMGLAALALHEATGDSTWFELGLELAQMAEADYRDPDGPGWFDTPIGPGSNLPVRSRTLEDGAQPSGVSLMAELCLRLHALTGDTGWHDRAQAAMAALSSAADRFPSAFGALLTVMAVSQAGLVELALLAPDHSSHSELLQGCRQHFRPELVIGVGRVPSAEPEATAGPPLVRFRQLLRGLPTAYVCRNFSCRLPVTGAAELDRELAAP
jgi:uncharacterized protein YyaL (SSP411 family)